MANKLNIVEAVNQALMDEMKRDETIVVYGEDVGVEGGVFRATVDLQKKFGKDRAFDTPLAESAIVGTGIGMAINGLKPVVEMQFMGFSYPAFNQIISHVARMRNRSRGRYTLPMVIRAPYGGGIRALEHHSESTEALYAHIPGLKVVCPSTAKDAKGLIKAAIRDDDPVIFLEHKLLYARKEEVPEEEYIIPLGQADVKREGKDITIITWSRQVYFALEAAEELAKEGIDAEVLDLRTLVPLDWEAIRESVCKTHNVVVVHEGVKRSGYGGELSAQITEELFDELDSPVTRVAALNVVPPFAPTLEDAFFPHPEDIVKAVKKVLNR